MDTENLRIKQNYLEGFKLIAKLENYFIETWKNIEEFDNYSVSSFGNVRNDSTERILKKSVDGHGYYNVNLYKNGKAKTCKIHKLVATTFLENPYNKKCIDHKNRNKLDNKLSNLRYATNSENQMNRSKQKNNTSGITGVIFYKKTNKWLCNIKINGKLKHLGLFSNKQDAIQKRIESEIKYFGKFRAQ